MANYKHALIAINLAKNSHQQVIEKTLSLVDQGSCRLSLAYVIRPLAFSYDRGLTLGLIDQGLENLQLEAETQTRERMAQLAKKFNIPEDRVHTLTGNPAAEIVRLAKELICDLVVLGNNHTRTLLGNTKGGVLHAIKCDTMLISIND